MCKHDNNNRTTNNESCTGLHIEPCGDSSEGSNSDSSIDSQTTPCKSCTNTCTESEQYSKLPFWIMTGSLLFLLLVICGIMICGIIYVFCQNGNVLPGIITTAQSINLTDNFICGSVELKDGITSILSVPIFYAIIVIVIAFLLYKIIVVLRDLIENEQINHRMNR